MFPSPVKRVVHFGSRSYGRITAPARMLPSFLICGGQRCGTTSLYRALAAHPVVLKAVLHKGVHYFDTAYHRGLAWYRGHFPLQRTALKVEQRFGVPAQTFESSPYYMYHPHAVARIARDLPGVKLIALVRDPVERAYSQHAHELARGFESETSFGRALALEPARLRGQEERLAVDPTVLQLRPPAPRLPGARRVRHLPLGDGRAGSGATGCWSWRASGSSPRPRRCTTRSSRSSSCRTSAIRRSSGTTPGRAVAPMDERIRRELTAHFAVHDERLADFLGHKPVWRP